MPASLKRGRPPSYELFFAPLEVLLKSPKKLERIQFAYFQSKFGHYKQKRVDGTRFFDHPKTASWIYTDEFGGKDYKIIIELLLHDIQEDSYILSLYRIAHNFGKKIALDLRALTKLPKGKETTAEYVQRIIKRGYRAIIVKLCDKLSNLRDMHHPDFTQERRDKQIEEARIHYQGTLIQALRECGPKWHDFADKMEKKIDEAIAEYD